MQTSGRLENTIVSIFSNAKWDKKLNEKPIAHSVKLKTVLERIRDEKAMDAIKRVRAKIKRDDQNEEKLSSLPVICFTGEFKGTRCEENFVKHSGLECLDFDKLPDTEISNKKRLLSELPFVVACFVSPTGKGIKAVVRVLDGEKRSQHYLSLLKDFPDADPSTKDVARCCYECADKEIYINYKATAYSKIVEVERSYVKVQSSKSSNSNFSNIEKWLEKKRNIYESGNRNNFIFALASACCRFGITEQETASLIEQNYLSKDSEFTVKEMMQGVKSAYSRNEFGTAEFTDGNLVEKQTTKEIQIDLSQDVVDVIYGEDCYSDALKIYSNGYESAEATGIPQIDKIFKWKRGELTVLTGIGNYGKSEFLKFLMINKSIKDDTKWALFSPENFPAHEFYHDLTETLVGANCTPTINDMPNLEQPPEHIYKKAYDYISDHFFYIYPKEVAPTPEYIRSRFLELILKEKIDGVIIDPFNQLSNDYGTRDDKYLESFLAECSRFAIKNNVYYMIVAHPHKLQKDKDTKAYPAPDIYDLAGGAMWNNKVDNILVYHRPNHHTDAMDRTCELITKKIRRQKIVGIKGTETFEYDRKRRRFVFDDFPLKKFDLSHVEEQEPHRLNEPKNRQLYGQDTPF